VHITLRGRWPNTGPSSFTTPSDLSPLSLEFDKLAFTPAATAGERRHACGKLLKYSFAKPEHCRSSHVASASHALLTKSAKAQSRHLKESEGKSQATRARDPQTQGSGSQMQCQLVDKVLLEDFGFAVEDVQRALAESLEHASARSVDSNAEVCQSLLRHKLSDVVYLMEYTRDPASFHQALDESTILSGCQRKLEEHGCVQDEKLLGGARVYVHPEQFQAVLAYIRFEKHVLHPRHVFVAPDLSSHLADCIRQIRCREKVKCKSRNTVPLSFLEVARNAEFPVMKLNTFIAVRTPSSMCASLPSAKLTV